jgi:hypothetical protein
MPTSAKVSPFELLVKPIASNTVTFARTAISGYFLTFTNLGPTANFSFLLVFPRWDYGPSNPNESYAVRELTTPAYYYDPVPPPPPKDPSGTPNHQAFIDITGGPVYPGGGGGQTYMLPTIHLGSTPYVRVFVARGQPIPSGQTASFRLLPYLGGGPDLLVNQNLEVRGFVAIGMSAWDVWQYPPETQVLLAPEHRTTFVPTTVTNTGSPVSLSDVDQVNTSLVPFEGPTVTLTAPQSPTLPPNVQSWASQNGAPFHEVLPYAQILEKIV